MSLFRNAIAAGLTYSLVGPAVMGTAATFLANHACATTNATPTLFSLPFNLTNSLIRIAPATNWGIFHASDTVTISSSNQAPIRIISVCGDQLYSGAPGDFQLGVGHYFVETKGDRTQFAVLPDDYQRASFLGADGGKGDSSDNIPLSTSQRFAQVQPAWIRCSNAASWATIEPSYGVWNWTNMDAFVASNSGTKIVINSGFLRPSWVTDDNFIPWFAEYIGAVAARYNGKIYSIEIWNEPVPAPPSQSSLPATATANWNTLTQFYANLLQAAQQAVRAVSSSIRVVGPAWYGTGFIPETKQLTALGANQWLDDLSFHDYTMKVIAPDSTSQTYLDSIHLISGIDSQCQEYQAAMTGKPLIVDEIGLYGHSALGIEWGTDIDSLYVSDLDWNLGMRRAIKYVVMYRAAGVEALIPHVFLRNAEYPTDSNLEIYGWDLGPGVHTARGPHPKTSAFLMSCHWLNGATFLGRQIVSSNALLYAWSYPDGSSVTFAWCREGYSTAYESSPTVQVTDVFSQPITGKTFADNPILFHTPASISPNNVLDTIAAAVLPPQADYPDLIVPGLGCPAQAAGGDIVEISDIVANIGTNAGQFAVGFYLRSETTGDILIGARTVDGLLAGDSSAATTSVAIPVNILTGTYYLVSLADCLNQLMEISKENNSRVRTAPIVINSAVTDPLSLRPPVLTQVRPKAVRAGRLIRIRLSAKSPNRKPLAYSIGPLPPGATFDPLHRKFEWTPTPSQRGQYTLVATVIDGKLGDTKPVKITVH